MWIENKVVETRILVFSKKQVMINIKIRYKNCIKKV